MTEVKAEGVRRSILEELNKLIGYTMENQVLLDEDVLAVLVRLTKTLGREILVMTNDKSKIEYVGVGDASKVPLDHSRVQENRKSLNRIRVIHTHPGGNPHLSEEDFSASDHLSVECMVAVGVGEDKPVLFGIGAPVVKDGQVVYGMGICESLGQLNRFPLENYVLAANRALRRDPGAGFDLEGERERALLIGVEVNGSRGGIDLEESMEELARLVETAEGDVAEVVTQHRPQVDPVFYVGRGKLLEILKIIQNKDINLIVANDELSANQIGNIEGITGVKTIDRTTIILDIFARQAKTREGKLQVELAQQKYRLSHLKGLGIVLSRTGGGIGTRGPGEKKLETDRRRIRERIAKIKKELDGLRQQRAFTRARRARQGLPVAALVGYTNAGKSTLLNALTRSEVLAEDKLFATLDPTTRRLRFPEEHELVLADTVGFIRNLPKELTEAFQATLEELEAADLLLHVADASHPELDRQIAAVDGILADMELNEVPRVLILNKWDRLEDEMRDILRDRWPDALPISAETRDGLNALSRCIENTIHWETTANIEITGPMPKVY